MTKFNISRYNFANISDNPPTFREILQTVRQAPKPIDELMDELAFLTERAPETVRMWAYNVQMPSPDTLRKLEDFFGIKAEDLFPKLKQKEIFPDDI